MSVKIYDTAKMRNAAREIRAHVVLYEKSKNEIDTTVNEMHSYWDDSVNKKYVNKYNTELKETADDLEKLMNEYADFLDESAAAIDKVIEKANSGMN